MLNNTKWFDEQGNELLCFLTDGTFEKTQHGFVASTTYRGDYRITENGSLELHVREKEIAQWMTAADGERVLETELSKVAQKSKWAFGFSARGELLLLPRHKVSQNRDISGGVFQPNGGE